MRGMHPIHARQLRFAAALHDIGKLQIPKSILEKPCKLTKNEFKIIKTHTTLGAEMLRSIQGDIGEIVRLICLYHHEWHDGTHSYWGLRASELPEYIHIVSICDAYTALITRRSYKEPWLQDEALNYIQTKAGTQFEPSLVTTLLSLMKNDDCVPAIFNST